MKNFMQAIRNSDNVEGTDHRLLVIIACVISVSCVILMLIFEYIILDRFSLTILILQFLAIVSMAYSKSKISVILSVVILSIAFTTSCFYLIWYELYKTKIGVVLMFCAAIPLGFCIIQIGNRMGLHVDYLVDSN